MKMKKIYMEALKYFPLINFIAQQKSIWKLFFCRFYFNYYNSVWLNHLCTDNKIAIRNQACLITWIKKYYLNK